MLGFVDGGGGGVFAELGEQAGFGDGWGLEVEEALAGGVDAGNEGEGGHVLVGLEDLGELIEGDVVVVGDVDGRAVGVEQVPEQGVELVAVEDRV
ncbi:MAG: hypothetical protein R3B67_10795 [Phycisphaerales bacterium]